jgi:hypothetical protein
MRERENHHRDYYRTDIERASEKSKQFIFGGMNHQVCLHHGENEGIFVQ